MNEGKRGFKMKKHVVSLDKVKQRNPVAKNASAGIGGGAAGAHKDKKKAAKQGDTKHKKTPAEMLEGAAYERALSLQLKIALVENLLDEAGHGSNRGYRPGFASPTAPSLGSKGREDDEGNSEFDDKMRALTGMIFYNVNDPEMASALGLKQTRTGKWFLRTGNRNAQKAADQEFGPGKVWYPKNEGMTEGTADFDKALSTIGGWYEDESSNPNIRVYHYDDREGGYYADGEILHNLKTGRIKINFQDSQGGDDIDGTFNSVGDAMNALRGGYPGDHGRGSNNPKHDSLASKTLVSPDDLYKTDKKGRKGSLTKSRMDVMKASSPYTMRGGPKGPLPENFDAEYDDEAGMADNNLETLKRAVQGLDNLIGEGDNLPEWCQEKIAVAKSMLVAVWDYMASEEQGVAEVQLTPLWQDDPEHLEYRKKQADISTNTGLAVGDLVTLKNRPGFEGKIVRDWGGGDFTISGSGGGMSQSNNHRANARNIQKLQGVAEGSPKDPKAPTQVKDRKTGKMYNPAKEFDKTMNSPEVKAQMQRMAQKESVAVLKQMIAEGKILDFLPPFKSMGRYVDDRRGNTIIEASDDGVAKELAGLLNNAFPPRQATGISK